MALILSLQKFKQIKPDEKLSFESEQEKIPNESQNIHDMDIIENKEAENDETENATESILTDREQVYLPVKIRILDEMGKLIKWEAHFYDDNGNKLGENLYNSDGTLVYFFIFEYDENGYLRYGKYKRDDYETEEWLEYEFDADGNRIRSKRYMRDEDGTKFLSGESTFDSDENLLCVKEFESSGDIYTWLERIYDSQGRKTGVEYYDSDGVKIGMTEYTYDDTGRLISCRYHNGRRLDYEYDTKGNLIHETEYRKDGTFAGRKEYGYDERGNQVSSAEFDEAEKGIDAR